MSHVFLSYSRRDQAFVDRLIAALEQSGFETWIDREDIAGGAAWEATISGAVRDSAALVVVMSPAAAESEYVPRELSLADKYDRHIIPVLLEPWEAAGDSEQGKRLEFQLAGLQYVDFARRPFAAGVQDLVRALRHEDGASLAHAPAAPAARPRRQLALAAMAVLVAATLAAVLLSRGRTAPPAIAGTWRADVAYPWGVRVTERFRFAVDGDAVSGTASFLGAPRGILDGRLADGRLSFRTAIEAGRDPRRSRTRIAVASRGTRCAWCCRTTAASRRSSSPPSGRSRQPVRLVRPAAPGDAASIHDVHARAFERPQEAALVDVLREADAHVVSLVAEEAGAVVGHVLFSPVTIGDGGRGLGLGPMAVVPEHQRQGLGSLLVRHGLDACRELGHGLVVVLGHPAFYRRFGFVPAAPLGLRSEYDVPDDVFMMRELRPGALAGTGGLVRYHPEFARV